MADGVMWRRTERGFLEFHHAVPFADGGPTAAANLQLRCRAHNLYEADERFGSFFVREQHGPYQAVPGRVGPATTDSPAWIAFTRYPAVIETDPEPEGF